MRGISASRTRLDTPSRMDSSRSTGSSLSVRTDLIEALHSIDADIEQFVSNCHACRRSKVPRDKTPRLLRPLPIPDRPWQHIAMDFKDMPPDKNGRDMVCVFVDRLAKKPMP